MIVLDLGNQKTYDAVLSYIFKECDEVSFHFPILDAKTHGSDEYKEDFINYEKNRRIFMEELFKNGATRQISRSYQGMKLGYDTQIFRVKLYPKLKNMITEHHLFDWLWWNSLPEDLCFFSKKTCKFITISHEEVFYVCDEKKDRSLISKIEKIMN